eukprot:TRINITY_DN9200_c0_g1_i1.p3 TRINITY_DN9200_c0_g1~~TRINITY_DN9200_c0_g1_i1.p3  ORF type:complete len:180 (+),score=66.52 TRINITY_DN9200_c0_g1_i1:256-795(+)
MAADDGANDVPLPAGCRRQSPPRGRPRAGGRPPPPPPSPGVPPPLGAYPVAITRDGAPASFVATALPLLLTREPGPGVTLVAAGPTIAKAITVCELLRRLVPSLSVLTQLRSAAVAPVVGAAAPPRPASASSPRRAAVATPAIVITLAADLSAYRGEPGYATPATAAAPRAGGGGGKRR